MTNNMCRQHNDWQKPGMAPLGLLAWWSSSHLCPRILLWQIVMKSAKSGPHPTWSTYAFYMLSLTLRTQRQRETNFIEFTAYLIDRILRAFSGAPLSSRLLQHTLTWSQGGKKSQELMILTRMSPALMAHSHWLLLQYDFIFWWHCW